MAATKEGHHTRSVSSQHQAKGQVAEFQVTQGSAAGPHAELVGCNLLSGSGQEAVHYRYLLRAGVFTAAAEDAAVIEIGQGDSPSF